MERGAESETHDSHLGLASALYWVLLISFLASFLLSGSSISLVLTADRIIDAVGMTIAMASQRIVLRPPTSRMTYGYHRFESLSSVILIFTFIVLLIYSAFIAYYGMLSGASPDPDYTIYASIISLAILPVISILLHGGENLTTATMGIHAIQDIITTLMALVSSLILVFYQVGYARFTFSVLIIIVSLLLNRNLMVRNFRLLMEGTELDAENIETGLRARFPMVHHIHIWDVCRHYRLATVHVYADRDTRLGELEDMRKDLSAYLSARGVNHLTVQFEPMEAEANT